MPPSMIIPAQWLAEAGVQNFRALQRGFRCDDRHSLIALADIEVPLRKTGYPLDANGFSHDRMVSILKGVRENLSLPPIRIEIADPGLRQYRVREGLHRYHASLKLGFSHIPAEIVERTELSDS